MARSGPDWGSAAPTSYVTVSTDVAELAARLGSVFTWDRRGKVAWFDDFEHNTQLYFPETTGDNGSVDRGTYPALSHATAYRLLCGDAEGNSCTLTHSNMYPGNPRLGYVYAFTMHSALSYIRWELVAFVDGRYYEIVVKYDVVSNTLVISDGIATTLKTFTNFFISYDDTEVDPMYHFIKVVVDASTGYGVRILVDADEYDISDCQLGTDTDTVSDRIWMQITTERTDADQAVIYIDHIALTMDEP